MFRFITFFTLLFFYTGHAQELLLKGTVSDKHGALPGVTVVVKNTNKATSTDLDGQYSLYLNKGEVVEYSFLGYKSYSFVFEGQGIKNVQLTEDSKELDEVVIQVPYGTANKKTYTGSVGVIQAKNIEKNQVSNISRVLEGSVAGVQSFAASGQPGSEATIRIRGIGSINASSNPLYVVDGVPYEGGLSSISPSDIESISILKDATAATLYGSRAANGVIMITTKQGSKEMEPQIDFSARFGMSSRARSDYKKVGTNDYMEMYWEAIRNGRLDTTTDTPDQAAAFATQNLISRIGINPYGLDNAQPVGLDGKLKPGLQPLWNADWEDALSQRASYSDINLRVSGGGAKSKYYISGGLLNDKGYVLQSDFKRVNFRSNIVLDAKDWLELGLNVSGSHSVQNYPKQDDSAIENVILFGRAMPNFYPIYQRDLTTGDYLLDPKTGERLFDFGNYRASSYSRYNLVATLPLDKNEIKNDVATVRTHAQIKFLDNLKYKTTLNVDYKNENRHFVTNPDIGPSSTTGGSVSRRNTRTVSMTYNNVLSYNLDLSDRSELSLMAGQEYYQYKSNYFEGQRQELIMLGYEEPDAASRLINFFGKADEYKMLSFFGNASYALDKKYYLSASFRRDGSSRFDSSHRWGNFWSVGASWRIIDEDFMEKYRDTWLSNLMVRTSYGAQGNDNIGYYAYQALYAIYNNLGDPGLVTSKLGTPELTWETNMNFNAGFDFGLFNNRLNGTVEYFERASKDLLFDRTLAPSLGFTGIQENIGKLKNYGLEVSLDGYPIMTDDWKWKLGVNMTTYRNKITSLPSSEIWSGNKKWVEGGSVYDFYLIEWAGINPENGRPQWYGYDANGEQYATEDYTKLKDSDKVKSGSSLPKFSGGFSSELTYKNWSLSTNFVYNIGGKIYNRDKISLMSQAGNGTAWSEDMLNRWTIDNRDTDVARLTTSTANVWTNASTRFLVDRSFLKLKTLALTYNVPKAWLGKMNIQNLAFYVQAENLFTWTKEQGLDPEQTFDGTTYYRYPAMKTISFGLNIKL